MNDKLLTMRTTKTYNVQIYVGLREQYSDKIHTYDEVKKICEDFTNEVKDCVTITPTEFIYVNGCEPGVIIGFINYPRFPKDKKIILDRATTLARTCICKLNQYRISIVTPNKTYLVE